MLVLNRKKLRIIRFSLLIISIVLIYYFKQAPLDHNNSDRTSTLKSPNEEQMIKDIIPFTFGDFLANHLNNWEKYSDETLSRQSEKMLSFLSNLNLRNTYPYHKGTGIVYTSNWRSISSVRTSIKLLRHFGCSLPIEVWHLNELADNHILALESMPLVKARNFADIKSDINFIRRKEDAGRLFIAKGAAIYLSSFEKVLFLDADNFPAQDPTFLFDCKQFKTTGALFWKDFWKTHPKVYLDTLKIRTQYGNF